MSMFDVAMVGRLGPEALAATGMGGMLVWALMSAALEYEQLSKQLHPAA